MRHQFRCTCSVAGNSDKKGTVMDRYLTLTIAGGLACLLFICLAVWMALRLTIYKECPSSTIMVIHRKNKPDRIVKYIIRGSAPVIPLIHDCSYIALPAVSFPINLKNAPIRNNVHIDISLGFSVQLSEDNNYLENAVNFLFNKSKHEIEEKVKQIMNEQVLLTLASFSVEEIFKNDRNDEFLQRIRSDADQRLKKVGLTTTNMECYWIYDDKEYYREVARRAVMEAVNSAKAELERQK